MALIAFLSWKILEPFFIVIFLSFITALIFTPLHDFFEKITKNRQIISSILSVITVVLIFLIPLIFIINLIIVQTIDFANEMRSNYSSDDVSIQKIIEKTNETLDKIPFVNYEITEYDIQKTAINLGESIGKTTLDISTGSISFTVGFISNLLLFLLLLGVFFPNTDKILKTIKKLSPMDDRIDDLYLEKFIAMSKSMIKGTFVIAIIQALLQGIFFIILGIPYVMFWMILIFLLSIIPYVGSVLIVVPVGIIMILLGDIWGGVILILSNIVIVSNADNILRPMLVSKDAKLHPMLVILGLFGGIKLFGIIGFVFGPIIMLLLVTTIDVYLEYYNKQ